MSPCGISLFHHHIPSAGFAPEKVEFGIIWLLPLHEQGLQVTGCMLAELHNIDFTPDFVLLRWCYRVGLIDLASTFR